MRAYLAGPMTGIKDFNRPMFNATAKRLRRAGVDVINPAEEHADIDAQPHNGKWHLYLRADLCLITQCDVVYLLSGWEKSRGATLEAFVAHCLGLIIVDAQMCTPIDHFVTRLMGAMARVWFNEYIYKEGQNGYEIR